MNPDISTARRHPADDALEILSFLLRQHADKIGILVDDDDQRANDVLRVREVVALDVAELSLLGLLGTPLHVLGGDGVDRIHSTPGVGDDFSVFAGAEGRRRR